MMMSSLTTLDVSNWDTSQVTNMSFVFWNLPSLTNLDISNWDTTSMAGMFVGASSLTYLDVSNWDTSSVVSMQGMFSGANSLTSLDVSNWDTSQATSMNGMFANTSSLTYLEISNWDTSQVTDIMSMFLGASSLTSLDVSNWDTNQVTGMSRVFEGASSLTSLDLSNWDTNNVIVMNNMLSETSSLSVLTLGANFEFIDDSLFEVLGLMSHADLPPINPIAKYTGYWQNVGSGTIENPLGNHVLTSAALMASFNGSTMADTFVWQPANESPFNILSELIAEAEARNQSNYTPRSWADMMSRLTFARNVYNNSTATEAQINEARASLEAALAALVER